MIIIKILLFIALLVLYVNFLYLFILAFFSFRSSKNIGSKVNLIKRFCIIIPAHNEEVELPHMLKTLFSVNYEKELLRCIVLADNCSDSTVDVALSFGCEVIENDPGASGKSRIVAKAISQVMDGLAEDEMLVVFDSDNRVDKEFFAAMSRAASQGHNCLQGNTGIANKTSTIFTRLNYVNFAVTNLFKEKARSMAGLTPRLRGHGMVFTKDILKKLDWKSESMVEDQELLLSVVLNEERVEWVHDAIVESVIPDSVSKAASQRIRWAGGKQEVKKKAIGELWKKYLKDKRFLVFDLLVDYYMPSYSILLGGTMFIFVISVVLPDRFGLLSIFSFGLILLFFLYYYVGSLVEKVPLSSFLCFLISPSFIVWRVFILIRSMSGVTQWK